MLTESHIQHNPFQITIDGPAASGKSTAARILAGKLGVYYINTGEMYRAVTWFILQAGIDPGHSPSQVIELLSQLNLSFRVNTSGNARENGIQLYFNDQPVDIQAIRDPDVTRYVSQLAAISEVRERLVSYQRQAAQLGTIVMEGRDIGTVVFPEARVKFFVTASPEVRARRRLAQSGEVKEGATLQSVIDDITRRDHLDCTRAIAPLCPAADAVIIDTSQLSLAKTVDAMIAHLTDIGIYEDRCIAQDE